MNRLSNRRWTTPLTVASLLALAGGFGCAADGPQQHWRIIRPLSTFSSATRLFAQMLGWRFPGSNETLRPRGTMARHSLRLKKLEHSMETVPPFSGHRSGPQARSR